MSFQRPSYATNGSTNGHSNSYTAANAQRLARFDFDTTPETSADERSRSRGGPNYQNGGRGGGSRQQHQEQHVRGPLHLERQQATTRPRSRDYGGGYGTDNASSRSRSRNPPRSGYNTNDQVDEILRYITQHWSFMTTSTCCPIKTALQLMDPSSLGLADQYGQFQDVHTQLQNALKVIVNEHHQGFNSSIGTFHKIQTAIHSSQHRVRTLRAGLVQAKSSLSTARPELRAYATSSQSYEGMLAVLGQIEELRQLPDLLDTQISEKRFLAAVGTLQEGLALIRRPELAELGALSELKLRLSNQEQFLADHLVEELHNHLYLKSPYCEGRWKALSVQSGDATEDDRAVFAWLEGYDGRVAMIEDPTRNPEADSFYYIQILVESLDRMGRLDSAVDEIERRLPVELFKVVERSHGEVEVRHPEATRVRSTKRQKQVHNGAAGKGGVGVEQEVVLRDLLGTLYAKFEAIGEGHRVLHEVTGAILKREGTGTGSQYGDAHSQLNRSFRELWKLLQSEIRSLLHDHLTLTGAAGGMGGGKGGREDVNANMFRLQAGQRNKNKKMFKVSALSETGSMDTAKSLGGVGTDVLATEQEDLLNMLKDSVPGLVNTSHAALAHGGREQQEMVMADKSATGHKLLVEPSLFNMSILLPPSLGFLHRLRDLVPPASSSGVVASTSTGFLDDFLINVFYPQLDETLTELCAGGPEDFQIHPHWQKFSTRPIFKGAIRFFEVVEMVCGMLVALPHEQSFSRLVVREMRGWYERCFQWSKGLLSRAVVAEGQAGIRLAAELATSGSVNEVVIELMKDNGDGKEGVVLAEKESALLVKIVGERGIQEADLILERKALGGLCTLLVSMRWLAGKCGGLRFVSERAVDMGGGEEKRVSVGEKREKIHNHHVRRWTSAEAQLKGGLEGEPNGVYLPLDSRTAEEFDGVLSMFTELSTLVLRTLHVDLRLQLLHGVAQALGHSYELGQAYNDPDPSILELSTALGTYDGVIEGGLLGAQYKFLTRGLSVLGNNALTSAPMLGSVGAMDEYGLARMQLNVLVLQQAIKNLDAEGSLSRSVEFLALGEGGCEGIVTKGKSGGFDREDLKVLVRLCWREERDGIDGDADWWVAKVMQEDVGGKSFPKRAASLRRGK
ncbi:exocyst subunit [Elasticomyces elasticus]|nr:exocyst subunit [Elasticomyces elasticus]KAK4974966.1 exocyst subunit [Elasticomyces elasticus]